LRKISYFFLATAALLGIADARAQTLPEAMAAAYQNNPALLAQRARLRAIDEGVPQALAGWRPTITFTSEYGFRDQRTDGLSTVNPQSSDGVLHPFTSALTLAQPIYRGGRTAADTESAEANVRAGRADLASAEQAIFQQVATAYMDVLRDQAVVELTRNNERILTERLTQTEARFSVGEITRTDVSQAVARLARARSDRISAEGALALSRANFQRAVGDPPGALKDPAPLGQAPKNEAEAQTAAAVENPDLQAAAFREEAARSDVRSAVGGLLPTVSLNGSMTRSEESSQRDVTTEVWRATAQFSMPLYEAGATYSLVRQRRETRLQRQLDVDDRRRQVRESVTRAWEAVETARGNITALQAQVEANRVALDGVTQEAEVGARTTLDVLDAEQELLDSQVNLVRAKRDEFVAGVQLRAATGRFDARNIGLAVDLYDPTKHYGDVRNKWFGFGGGSE
jgi:outer membrane protein